MMNSNHRSLQNLHASNSDDDQVTAAVQADDPRRAATLLMSRYGTSVYRFVLSMTGNPILADDIHQQVFLEAYRDLPRFRGQSSVRVWLLGIARHRCIDAMTTSRRWNDRFKNESPAERADDEFPADRKIDRFRLLRVLAGCLTRLTPASRQALKLRFHDELSYEEASSIAGVCAATLQRRVTRALPLLRQYITAELCWEVACPVV